MRLPAARSRLQLGTQVFPPDEVPAGLRWAGRLGIGGVEIGPDTAKAMRDSSGERSAILSALRAGGFAGWSLHAWTQVDGLEEVCAFAVEIGAALVVVHCPHASLCADFDGQVRLLRQRLAWCRERNVILTVENASRQPLSPFLEVFEAVDGLRATLDIKHAYKPDLLGLTHKDYLPRLGPRCRRTSWCWQCAEMCSSATPRPSFMPKRRNGRARFAFWMTASR